MLFKKEAIVYCNDVPPNEIQEELKLQRERKNQKERERYAKMDPAAKAEFNKRRSARRKEQRMIKRQAMMPPYASTVDVVSKEMEITLRLLVHLFAQLNLQVPAFVNAVNPSAPKRQRLASLMPSEVLFTLHREWFQLYRRQAETATASHLFYCRAVTKRTKTLRKKMDMKMRGILMTPYWFLKFTHEAL